MKTNQNPQTMKEKAEWRRGLGHLGLAHAWSLRHGAVLLAVAAWLAAAGCQSGRQPGSYSHASTRIEGKALPEIQSVAAAVFREAGYDVASKSPELMVFERLGSRRDMIKYGGWVDNELVMRVNVQFREMGQKACVLQADVHAVRAPSDSFFREDSRVVLLNPRPYQKLLDQIRQRLR